MINTIPDSIGDLKYLQYIGLINCINLFSLPGSIVRLHKLRALHIKGANVNEIPKGIGKLENLVELTGFLTQNDDTTGWNSLEELGHLSQLRPCLDSKKFHPKVSHRNLRHMHEVLNVDEKKINCTVG